MNLPPHPVMQRFPARRSQIGLGDENTLMVFRMKSRAREEDQFSVHGPLNAIMPPQGTLWNQVSTERLCRIDLDSADPVLGSDQPGATQDKS